MIAQPPPELGKGEEFAHWKEQAARRQCQLVSHNYNIMLIKQAFIYNSIMWGVIQGPSSGYETRRKLFARLSRLMEGEGET
jgi:hypothetical protein